jgi:hypothetical protein
MATCRPLSRRGPSQVSIFWKVYWQTVKLFVISAFSQLRNWCFLQALHERWSQSWSQLQLQFLGIKVVPTLTSINIHSNLQCLSFITLHLNIRLERINFLVGKKIVVAEITNSLKVCQWTFQNIETFMPTVGDKTFPMFCKIRFTSV